MGRSKLKKVRILARSYPLAEAIEVLDQEILTTSPSRDGRLTQPSMDRIARDIKSRTASDTTDACTTESEIGSVTSSDCESSGTEQLGAVSNFTTSLTTTGANRTIYHGEQLSSAITICKENQESLRVLPSSVRDAFGFLTGFVDNVMTYKAVSVKPKAWVGDGS